MASCRTPEIPQSRFTKSLSNRQTEKSGLGILLRDPRFQWVDTATKRQHHRVDRNIRNLWHPDVRSRDDACPASAYLRCECRRRLRRAHIGRNEGDQEANPRRDPERASSLEPPNESVRWRPSWVDKYRFAFVVLERSRTTTASRSLCSLLFQSWSGAPGPGASSTKSTSERTWPLRKWRQLHQIRDPWRRVRSRA